MFTRAALLLAVATLAAGCDAPLDVPLSPTADAAAPSLVAAAGDATPVTASEPASGPIAWTTEPLPFPITILSGTSATRLYGAGNEIVARYDGGAWTDLGVPFLFAPADLWAPSGDVVFGLQHCSTVLKHERDTWSSIGPPGQALAELDGDKPLCFFYWSVSGLSETHLYLAGEFGQVRHYDGTSWTDISPATFVIRDELNDVWASSGSDVFVVGGDYFYDEPYEGSIYHYDGSSWTTMFGANTPTIPILHAVWGSSSTDVFAVGREGTILHYDGLAWTAMESGTAAHLNSIAGTSATNVYAAGSNGLLHYDGTAWSPVATGTSGPLWSVTVVARGDVFALGGGGLLKGTPGS